MTKEDSQDIDLKFGDLVRYDLSASHGGGPDTGYVIGEAAYSEAMSHPVLATESALGMPINAGHCAIVSGGHEAICRQLRERYLARFPNTLAPLGKTT